MRSIYAVLAQIMLSASNYAVFVALSRLTDERVFVAFSTAVGLNMLAYAVAEGGVSYVAPKVLSEIEDQKAASLAGAFIGISGALYVMVMGVGFMAWNLLSAEGLHAEWVAAYAVFFAPALAMPSWLTSRAIDRTALLSITAVRAGMVVGICLFPTPSSLWFGGVFAACHVAWLLRRADRCRCIIAFPKRESVKAALAELRKVFAARTASYAAYAALPLLVGVIRGNTSASQYVTAERLKSLYATLFQPVIQSLYLWQFQRGSSAFGRRIGSASLQVFNILACAGLLLATHQGWLNFLGDRLATVPEPFALWLAAAFSVATAGLLHLHVFPSGSFSQFRRASIIQLIAFVSLIGGFTISPGMSAQWLLFGGELALLLAVALPFAFGRKSAA